MSRVEQADEPAAQDSAITARRVQPNPDLRRAVRVFLLASHPVQWAVPLYRLYAIDRRLDLTVAYCMLHGVRPSLDRDFGVKVKWDVPLLDGYKWVLSRNWSIRPAPMRVMGLVNPGLWRIVRRGHFDVAVICGYMGISYWIAALAARMSGSAVVLATDANSLESAKGHSWKSRIKSFVVPRLFNWFDAVLVPSTAAASFAREVGTEARDVFMAPYVVDNDYFREGAKRSDRNETRRRWSVPDGAFVALFCGKLVPWKRPQDVLLAAKQIKDVHVVYAGDGPLRGELQRLARTQGVEDRVHFLGFVNQSSLPAVYRAADVLVLPSAFEPFGLVVNEAFACGTPAIVSAACGSAGDLVRDGTTGFVVEVGKAEDIADRLHRLVADPLLRAAMSERAQERVGEWGPAENARAFAEACLALATRARVS